MKQLGLRGRELLLDEEDESEEEDEEELEEDDKEEDEENERLNRVAEEISEMISIRTRFEIFSNTLRTTCGVSGFVK